MSIILSGAVMTGGSMVYASDHSYPQTHAIQSMEGNHIIGGHLMTSEERKEFREKMKNARTPKMREQLLKENHEKMQKRAKERGVPLRKMPPSQGHLMDKGMMDKNMHDTQEHGHNH